MIAHVAGAPVEELISAGALAGGTWAITRTWLAWRLRSLRRGRSSDVDAAGRTGPSVR